MTVTPAPSSSATAGLVYYSGEGSNQGFEFDYPAAWNVISGYHEVVTHGPTVMAAVGNGDFDINCTGSFPGAVQCGDPIWTVPPDGVVLVYHLQDWPQGPVVPYPTPIVGPKDQWVEIDGRSALFSQGTDGTMTWSLLGTPEVIEARYGNAVADVATDQIQAVVDSWRWTVPSATPRPTPITTGSGTATYEWQKVGEAQAGVDPIWAPDSNHVLIDLQAANEFDHLDLLDRAGNSVATATGVNNPMWLDSDVVVAYEGNSWPTQTVSDRAEYHTVSGRAISASDGTSSSMDLPCCYPMPNGHGAIAITRFVPDNTQDGSWPKTVVWQDGVQSAELDAVPLGWDLAGDKLAVIKPSQPSDRDYVGQVQVFSWPGLKPLFQGDSKDDYEGTFDPTGSYLSGTYSYQDAAGEWHMEIHVVDLASGSMATIPLEGDPTKSGGGFVWNDQGRLLVTTHNETLFTYRPDGTLVGQEHLPRIPLVQASADGSMILKSDFDADVSDTPSNYEVLRGGDWQPLTLPFDPSWRGVQLSPDGSQVFASTNTDVGVAGYLADIP